MAVNQKRKIGWSIVVLLSTISIGLVIRRLLIIAGVIQALPVNAKFGQETGLKDYVLLTLLHILPGTFFVICGPLLIRKPKLRNPAALSWGFAAATLVLSLTAIIMPFAVHPIGGITEAAAAILFGLVMLLELTQFAKAMMQKQATAYFEWLVRLTGLGLAIATTRPVMIIGFALGHLTAAEFLGVAFWLSFTVHLCVVEAWLHFRRVPNHHPAS